MRDIGKNIRDLRTRRNWSQDELAERLFVTRQTVSNYENGRTRPDVEQILRIAEVFGTDANAVLYGPPAPEGRRSARLRAAVGGGLVLALWAVYFWLLLPLAKNTQSLRYDPSYAMLLGCAVKPLLLLLTGWVLSQLLLLFVTVRLPQKPWVRRVRRALFAVSLYAILIPAAIYCLVRFGGSLPITGYWRLLYTLLLLNIKVPFLYSLLGAALGLLALPPEHGNTSSSTS